MPKTLKTAPVGAADSPSEPEFLRIPQLYEKSGIKRGLAYRHINNGTFRSVVIREPGNKQGVRLVYWPSVRDYLHRLMEEQSKQRQFAKAHNRHAGAQKCRSPKHEEASV